MADRPTLEETIALLEATLEATHDGILVVDLDRRIIRYNRQYLKMFGFTADELERGDVDGLIETVERRSSRIPRRRSTTSHAIWSDPSSEATRHPALQGRAHLSSGTSRRTASTRSIVGRVASFRDIGASVRTAEALEQHRAFLEKAQEVAHIGSWVAELDGSDRLGWSAETHRIFGVPLGQFEGTSQAFFALRPPRRSRRGARGEPRRRRRRPRRTTSSIASSAPTARVRWVHEKADILRDAQRPADCAWSAPCRTSPTGGSSRISCGSRRRWRRSAGWPAASRTISTTR